jgi:hypothetical protein
MGGTLAGQPAEHTEHDERNTGARWPDQVLLGGNHSPRVRADEQARLIS